MIYRTVVIAAVFALLASPVPSSRKDMHIEISPISNGYQGGLR